MKVTEIQAAVLDAHSSGEGISVGVHNHDGNWSIAAALHRNTAGGGQIGFSSDNYETGEYQADIFLDNSHGIRLFWTTDNTRDGYTLFVSGVEIK